jgi:hypothetical protein
LITGAVLKRREGEVIRKKAIKNGLFQLWAGRRS